MSFQGQVKRTYQFQEKGIVRVGTNADYTPGGNFNIFNIAGGPILVTSMWGHVRVACTGVALVPLIQFDPTIGAASPLCTVAVGAAHAIGVVLTWDGTLAGVLAPTAAVGHGQAGAASVESFVAGSIMLMPGVILIVNATADATAEIDWYMTYKPVLPEVNVTVL
jgi:hypothetical protein